MCVCVCVCVCVWEGEGCTLTRLEGVTTIALSTNGDAAEMRR